MSHGFGLFETFKQCMFQSNSRFNQHIMSRINFQVLGGGGSNQEKGNTLEGREVGSLLFPPSKPIFLRCWSRISRTSLQRRNATSIAAPQQKHLLCRPLLLCLNSLSVVKFPVHQQPHDFWETFNAISKNATLNDSPLTKALVYF